VTDQPERPSDQLAKINMGHTAETALRDRAAARYKRAVDELNRTRDSDIERAEMAKLREMRLAAEAKAGKAEGKAKRKPVGKAKR
jgi:hypothetical protein